MTAIPETPPAAPPTAHLITAWIAYVLQGVGLFSLWTAPLAALICHVRRGDPRAGFIDTHYRWLIRTFWWGLLWALLAAALILAGLWPLLAEAVRAGTAELSASPWGWRVHFDLEDLTGTLHVAAGVLSGTAVLAAAWLWTAYRLIRGALRLGEALPVP